MSAYDDFAEAFLRALYLETEKSEQEYHAAEKLLANYSLAPKPHWISRLADDWEFSYFKDVSKVSGGYGGWSFRISAEGARKVEEAIEAEETIEVVFGKEANGLKFSDHFEAKAIPASDRLVPLNHNSAEYKEIDEGLTSLLNDVRGNNAVGETVEERERIVRSLSAAAEYWASLELKVIQIRVGVVMAVEDAGKALERVGKATAWSLLVDLIKRLVKDKTGIEF
ncbi:hypothetical protein U4960_09450 [Altererythrobacter sp. H2]|uniref:hypothetical protein n=1 Tax=Altererythrobacter sp. H2 TaxID=3108391 RepID=UPI002B4BE0D5|nr:hypothetical protein [Altererythrobacter sp. H2]WRK94524.1 hypothetical protein U4960_09450 [Altererythrobacter sp. H2]